MESPHKPQKTNMCVCVVCGCVCVCVCVCVVCVCVCKKSIKILDIYFIIF